MIRTDCLNHGLYNYSLVADPLDEVLMMALCAMLSDRRLHRNGIFAETQHPAEAKPSFALPATGAIVAPLPARPLASLKPELSKPVRTSPAHFRAFRYPVPP